MSNCSANAVRKRDRHPTYFTVATWTTNLIVYFYNALDVFSSKMELISKSSLSICLEGGEDESSQTIQLKKIKTVALVPYHGHLVF